jgi:hypothetical protein
MADADILDTIAVEFRAETFPLVFNVAIGGRVPEDQLSSVDRSGLFPRQPVERTTPSSA